MVIRRNISPLRFVSIDDLISCVSGTINKVRVQVVAYTKLLMNYVERAEVLACTWEHGVKNRNMENVNGMH